MIGRKAEKQKLLLAYESSEPELVAVYGRRRIGKTYLVRETFDNKFTFYHTGAQNCSTKVQLSLFHSAMKEQGLVDTTAPKTWPEAFDQLKKFILQSKSKRKVVFIDEIPWMDAPRSGFLSAFEYFWNSWGSAQKNLLFIICGSSTSWIIKKIFKNRGGLHNRVTKKIPLLPFTLKECEEYAKYLKLGLTRNHIIEGYMVMGGVPLYWSKLDRHKSMAQNINDVFLSESGELRYEFNDIFHSIFTHPDRYLNVIECLSTKKSGMTRAEISKGSKLGSSGNLTDMLEELIQCGFIRKYYHPNKKSNDAIYQLVDLYTLFYYRFVKDAHGMDEQYWLKLLNTPSYNTWCGFAFEKVCLMHTRQIKSALGISGIMADVYSWHIKKTEDHPGVQIDLLIDRADNMVNICEMKYAPNIYTLTKSEADKIRTRLRVCSLYLSPKKGLQLVMITSNGLKGREHLANIDRELTADDLFLD